MKKFIKIIYLVILTFPLLFLNLAKASEKLKIGILAPMTGPNKNLGQSIIKSIRLAVKDINSNLIEVIPRDTSSSPEKTLQSAYELKEMGVRIVIGPIFYENLIYLDEIDDLTFLSLTNKTLDLPKNVISAGVNSTSQLNTIKRFLKEKMYHHKSVIQKTSYGKRVIKGLFLKINKNPKKYININNIKKSDIDRSICDFIAGMTDRFAINLYNKSK